VYQILCRFRALSLISFHRIPVRTLIKDKNAIARTEKIVAELESARAALWQLSLDVNVMHLEARTRLSHLRALADASALPNEILSKILLSAVSCGRNHVVHFGDASQEVLCAFQSAVAFSHVSKRYRLVTLDTPALWNRISDSMGPNVVEVCLRRSGAMPIEIVISPFTVRSRRQFQEFNDFLKAISTTTEIWSTITLCNGESDHSDRSIKPVLEQVLPIKVAFKSTRAPQLEILEIHIPEEIWSEDAQLSTIQTQPCRNWNLPRLHTMVSSQFVPCPFSKAMPLRCLNLEMGDRRRSRRRLLDVGALYRFLESCPTLTELRLSMSKLTESDSPFHPFALPYVETVSLKFRLCTALLIKTFLGVVTFPLASKLGFSLGVGIDDAREVSQWTQFVFDDPVRFPNVTSLELTVNWVDCDVAGILPIHLPWASFANIRRLTLCVPIFLLEVAKGEEQVPPLRYLRFRGCGALWYDMVCDFLKKLKEQDNLQYLQELRSESCSMLHDAVVDCRKFSPEELIDHVGAILRLY